MSAENLWLISDLSALQRAQSSKWKKRRWSGPDVQVETPGACCRAAATATGCVSATGCSVSPSGWDTLTVLIITPHVRPLHFLPSQDCKPSKTKPRVHVCANWMKTPHHTAARLVGLKSAGENKSWKVLNDDLMLISLPLLPFQGTTEVVKSKLYFLVVTDVLDHMSVIPSPARGLIHTSTSGGS